MIERNSTNGAQSHSRARRSPSGIPYTLLYPSTQTEAVTMANMGMTGRGIPYAPQDPLTPLCIDQSYPRGDAETAPPMQDDVV